MVDRLSPQKRSKIMRSIRSKDTKPELLVRKLAHALGYRFRLHCKDLPGKPDLVFPRLKKVIFVNGCFWHQHEAKKCPIASKPRTNIEYWEPKLTRTKERDKNNIAKLKRMGWSTLVIWECETKRPERVKNKIQKYLCH